MLTLLDDPETLAAATRWALETAFLIAVEPRSAETLGRALALALCHGAALVQRLTPAQARLLLEHVPETIAAYLRAPSAARMNTEALRWQASLVEQLPRWVAPERAVRFGELSQCVEDILVAGGDTRLRVDPASGLNRYGTVPRPRPDAVQFSSSTASSPPRRPTTSAWPWRGTCGGAGTRK